jgi:hypothetical protein
VKKYWADPEEYFDEMLKLVYVFWKRTMRDINETDE